jgi:hypothetical protein
VFGTSLSAQFFEDICMNVSKISHCLRWNGDTDIEVLRHLSLETPVPFHLVFFNRHHAKPNFGRALSDNT